MPSTHRLRQQAMEDRLRFDEAIRGHGRFLRLLVAHESVRIHVEKNHVGQPEWDVEGPVTVEIEEGIPEWFPGRSVLRSFIVPDFLVLIDLRDRAREIYRRASSPPPPALLAPGARLIRQGEDQGLMTSLDGRPYLIAVVPVVGQAGRPVARLMGVVALDDRFLLASQGPFNQWGSITALVGDQPPRVLVSSDARLVPAGTPVSALSNEYLTTGQAFFDYGASDLKVSFTTFMPRAGLHDLTRPILALERGQRTWVAAVLILFFVLVLAVFAHRLRTLVGRVAAVTREVFGVTPEVEQDRGSELGLLEILVARFRQEVVSSRQALLRESREKLRLAREQMEIQAENDRLRILHSITEAVGIGVARRMEDGTLVPVNPRMRTFADLCGGMRRFAWLEDGGETDIDLIDRNGERRVFEFLQPPGIDDDLVLVLDVTERRCAEWALKKANDELESRVAERTRELAAAKDAAEVANRSKSQFIANMSHELRTPLNAIIGFTDLMLSEILGPIVQAQYKSYLQDINQAGRHLLDIINDVLDVSKIDVGGIALFIEDVDVGKTIAAVARLVAAKAAEGSVRLSLEVAENLDPIRGDGRRIKQILLNLASNAIKFTPPGGEIRIIAGGDGGFTRIVVSDTGIGMTEDEISVALRLFGQVDSGMSRKYDGTGLGLPLSKTFAEMHGGSLAVESVKGMGTRVTVRLPVIPKPSSEGVNVPLTITD